MRTRKNLQVQDKVDGFQKEKPHRKYKTLNVVALGLGAALGNFIVKTATLGFGAAGDGLIVVLMAIFGYVGSIHLTRKLELYNSQENKSIPLWWVLLAYLIAYFVIYCVLSALISK